MEIRCSDLLEAKKVSNGWILTAYDDASNLQTTSVYTSSEQLIKAITNMLNDKSEVTVSNATSCRK